jgi:hypothetical protein
MFASIKGHAIHLMASPGIVLRGLGDTQAGQIAFLNFRLFNPARN